MWITKDRQMQSKNQRALHRRNFNKTVNASCAWRLTRWLPMTINCNQMDCDDVNLGILAAILNAQYTVRFVCKLWSWSVCRKHALKMEVHKSIAVQKPREMKEINTKFHRYLNCIFCPFKYVIWDRMYSSYLLICTATESYRQDYWTCIKLNPGNLKPWCLRVGTHL